MKKSPVKKMAKTVLSHIKKDDKEFRSQIKDDKKLTKQIKKKAR
jgi:hypothetical protein